MPPAEAIVLNLQMMGLQGSTAMDDGIVITMPHHHAPKQCTLTMVIL
jgi:hypothetical protein